MKINRFVLPTTIALLFALTCNVAKAENFLVQQFQRKLQVGMGKSPAIGTVRYPPSIKNGDTIVILADAADPDGDDAFVEWYVNGKLFTIQSERPYGVRIGPDIYGSIPVRVTVAVRTDQGDSSVAKLLITSTSFSTNYTCTVTQTDLDVTVASVVPTQSGNKSLSLAFEGSNSGTKVSVTTNLTISGTTASGTMNLTNGSSTELINLSGTVDLSDDGLNVDAFTVSDVSTNTELSCS